MKLSFIFIVCGVSIIFSLIIYTTWLWQNNVESATNAINGLVSPLISLISIYLLYQTLNKQIKSNKNQQKNLALETAEKTKANLLTNLELLKELFVTYKFISNEIEYFGIAGWKERLNYFKSEYLDIENKNTLLSPEIRLIYITRRLIIMYISIYKNEKLSVKDKNQIISLFILNIKLYYDDCFLRYLIELKTLKMKVENPLLNELNETIFILTQITSDNFETFLEYKNEIDELKKKYGIRNDKQ